jgi:hypothetical protein
MKLENFKITSTSTIFYVSWQNIWMNSVLALFGHIMQPLDICVEQIAYIHTYIHACDPLVLGNPLYAGVKMVAYFGNFGLLQRPKSARDCERKMIELLYTQRCLNF